MRILVTGAAGFIGSHTCEALIARGHDVVGVDSFDSYLYPSEPKRANAAHLAATLPATRFRLVEADIVDAAAMNAVITPEIDVVCHLAALAGVRPSLVEPRRYMRTNIEGTTAILEAMRAAGRTRLVFASSSSVYGAQPGVLAAEKARLAGGTADVVAFREDDPCLSPASPYAASKRMGELLVSAYRDLYGIGTSSLRFFTVYGPRQRPDMAIHKFTKAIAAGAPITLYGDGETRRDYTFFADIVAGVCAAIERVAPAALNVYNLGGSGTVSLRELVATVERVVGKPAIVNWEPDQPGDVPVTCADITRAARDLDYAPQTKLEAGIDAFWRWYQARA